MPSRTPVRPQQKRITNADLAAAIESVKGDFKIEIAELKTRQDIWNGYTADLKAMVDEWRAERKLVAARALVRAERIKTWAWVRGPWRWISLFLSALIGAFGWRAVSGIHFPW